MGFKGLTPAQSGRQILGPNDGNAFSEFSPAEEVQNAHDLQGAPASLYSAPLDNNITDAPSKPPVADRQADADEGRTMRPDNVKYIYNNGN